jgi:hypothetical protein
MTFVHVNFGDISDARLKQQLNRIHTNFRFSGDRNVKTGLTDEEAIECAVPLLFGRDNVCGARHIYSFEPGKKTAGKNYGMCLQGMISI